MLFDTYISNKSEYPHLVFLAKEGYELLLNTEDFFLVRFANCNIYAAETRFLGKDTSHDALKAREMLISSLASLHPSLLETTDEGIYDALRSKYTNGYGCFQYDLSSIGESDINIRLLKAKDLDFTIETYGSEDYMRRLFSEDRILGYYDNKNLIGYIARHVDGTLGALYVTEDMRNKGYGSKITKAAVAYYNDPYIYSQVIDDNAASIQMHVKMNAHKCEKKIYWLYDNGF